MLVSGFQILGFAAFKLKNKTKHRVFGQDTAWPTSDCDLHAKNSHNQAEIIARASAAEQMRHLICFLLTFISNVPVYKYYSLVNRTSK